ncbi:MAG: CoA pyrophosphatase [Candidatus Bathyarchaeota archaeon]|nr:CoA pyrophosphatase [Candidatus Bathyarchaeota archaeon]
MDKLEAIKSRLSNVEQEAWATVCVILRWDDEELETLVVKRAVVEGDPWSGDMAFPGGKKSPEDKTIRDTVRREAMEETGIDLTKAVFLGYFPNVLTSMRVGSTVLPQVYLYSGRPEIKLNSELTNYYWVHLSELDAHRVMAIVKERETQVFDLYEYKIWGLTYKMLNTLIEMSN